MQEKHAELPDTPEQGFVTTIDYITTDDGPRARKITVEATGDKAVNSTVLRKVNPQTTMRQHLRENTGINVETSDPVRLVQWLDKDHRKLGIPAGVDMALRLEAIRQVYEQAAANGEPPAQAVANAMGASLATAGRWIRKSKNQLGWS
ncbi:hypothetical protein ACXZ66_01950 [Corynebacterium sp. S7]